MRKTETKTKFKNNQKGITLIALVITIIVLLILAGIAISMLSGENGILRQAADSKVKTQLEADKEEIKLTLMGAMEKDGKINFTEVNRVLQEKGYKIANDIYTSENGNNFTIDEKGNIEYINGDIDTEVQVSYIEKEVQGSYIYLNNVYKEQHDLDVKLTSDTVTDFSTVAVKQYGANLFDHTTFVDNSNISCSYENGVITLVNLYEAATKVADFILEDLPAGTYTISGSCSKSLFCYIDKGDGWGAAINWSSEKKLTIDATFSLRLAVFVDAGGTLEIQNLQLQLGDSKTPYESYKETIYTPNADGTVQGMKSISPNMTILTNNSDVTINCKYRKTAEEIITSKVAGKKMAVIGDSISAGVSSIRNIRGDGTSNITTATSGSNNLTSVNKAWWQLVQQRYEISDDVINNSVTGACFSQDGSVVNGVVNNPRFTTYLNTDALPSDLDIIMIFGGTNDYSLDRPLGELTDEPSVENQATFCSAVKATLEYLTTNFPNAEIVYITPLPRWFETGELLTDENGNYYIEGGEEFNELNKANLYIKDYSDALKNLCALYDGVHVCDLYATSNMDMGNMDFRLQYAPDGLHPNAEGTKIYVENGIFPFLDKLWLTKEFV